MQDASQFTCQFESWGFPQLSGKMSHVIQPSILYQSERSVPHPIPRPQWPRHANLLCQVSSANFFRAGAFSIFRDLLFANVRTHAHDSHCPALDGCKHAPRLLRQDYFFPNGARSAQRGIPFLTHVYANGLPKRRLTLSDGLFCSTMLANCQPTQFRSCRVLRAVDHVKMHVSAPFANLLDCTPLFTHVLGI